MTDHLPPPPSGPPPQQPPAGPPPGWPAAPPQQSPADAQPYPYYVPPAQPQAMPQVPPGYVLVPAQMVAAATGEKQLKEDPRGRKPVPGKLARWDARAYASLVDIAVAAGILTAWQMTLVLVGPVLKIATWIAGDNWSNVVNWGTYLLMVAWWAWQWAVRGDTGQTLGQRLIGVAVVDEETHAPIGAARSLVRSVTHVLDVLPLWLGMARPAWDTKGQTWADKIHKTIAIEVERPAQIEK